jgi:hypothetical protein
MMQERIASAPLAPLYRRFSAPGCETGFRIVKKLKRLHVAATGWLTYYRIGPDRGEMLSGGSGIVMHDHWQSYS